VGRQRKDLNRRIRGFLDRVAALPIESQSPLLHYSWSSSRLWTLLEYANRKFEESRHKKLPRERHATRLNGMILVGLIENFERFVKETAAACVDQLGHLVLDDRFDVFKPPGSLVAVHFRTDSLGQLLCESLTWLNCTTITERFQKILADPFSAGSFRLFSKGREKGVVGIDETETLNLLWQLRHSAVHNVGVITRSDALKLRLMVEREVTAPSVLTLTKADIFDLRQFLDELVVLCNQRIGGRLAELLTTIHASDPTLFDAQFVADEISRTFQIALTVNKAAGRNPTSGTGPLIPPPGSPPR